MKKLLIFLLAFLPMALFAQNSTNRQISIGFNLWNEYKSSGDYNLIGDSTQRITSLKTYGFNNIKPFIEITKNNSTSWQLGLNKFLVEKEYYDKYDSRIGTDLNDTSNHFSRLYIDGYEEFRYAFECYGTYKYKTTKTYLPTLILQATFGFERTNIRPIISEKFPSKTFDIGSTISPGLEYSLKISERVKMNIGGQIPLFRLRYNYLINENSSWSIGQQRASQIGFTTYNLLYPQIRLGVNYKL